MNGAANKARSTMSITLGLEKKDTEPPRLDLRYDLKRADERAATRLALKA
jgi:hypothetical protein